MPPDWRHLERLLDELEYDEVISLVTVEDVAGAWCRYQARPHADGVEDEDPDWWAVELLMTEEFGADESRVRATLDLIVEYASDDDVLSVAGAGPLEAFVDGVAGRPERLQWIERRAQESDRFRQTLAHVWVWGLPPADFARLEAAAGVPLTRPAEGVVIEIVPGGLPGTIHIKRNGVTIDEIEEEPDRVDGRIESLRRLFEASDPR